LQYHIFFAALLDSLHDVVVAPKVVKLLACLLAKIGSQTSFQSYNSSIQTAARKFTPSLRTDFQSYNSSIQTKPVKGRLSQNSVFQSYNSSIQTRSLHSNELA